MKHSDFIKAVETAIKTGALKACDFQAALLMSGERLKMQHPLVRRHVFNVQLLTGRACG